MKLLLERCELGIGHGAWGIGRWGDGETRGQGDKEMGGWGDKNNFNL